MKTKKKARAPGGFSRGEKVSAKRRHGRKQAGKIQPQDEVTQKLETLTTL